MIFGLCYRTVLEHVGQYTIICKYVENRLLTAPQGYNLGIPDLRRCLNDNDALNKKIARRGTDFYPYPSDHTLPRWLEMEGRWLGIYYPRHTLGNLGYVAALFALLTKYRPIIDVITITCAPISSSSLKVPLHRTSLLLHATIAPLYTLSVVL